MTLLLLSSKWKKPRTQSVTLFFHSFFSDLNKYHDFKYADDSKMNIYKATISPLRIKLSNYHHLHQTSNRYLILNMSKDFFTHTQPPRPPPPHKKLLFNNQASPSQKIPFILDSSFAHLTSNLSGSLIKSTLKAYSKNLPSYHPSPGHHHFMQ